MFEQISNILVRWRWAVLAAWLGGAAVLAVTVSAPDPREHEPTAFVPEDAPSQQALSALRRHFPDVAGQSQAVIVIERGDLPESSHIEGLTRDDLEFLETIAAQAEAAGAEYFPGERVEVISPGSRPFMRDLLVSPRKEGAGQAALAIVQIPSNFITLRASDVVGRIQELMAAAEAPAGLETAVTGSAGFGHDYAQAANQSHKSTLVVTVAAVVGILLLVYRSPVAAATPLVAVGISTVVAISVLSALSAFGLRVGTGEKIFIYVLMYGSGVDYALFFLGRYREYLEQGFSRDRALRSGWRATAPAIMASGGTVIAGLAMLSLARYRVFQQVGPAVAVALTVTMLASLTLVPAMASIMGRRLFWPVRVESARRRWFWSGVARLVTRRPVVTLVVAGVALGLPALQCLRLTWVYDTLADLKSSYPAARGAAMIQRHWPAGELAPATVVIEWDAPGRQRDVTNLAAAITERLEAMAGVGEVRSLSSPLGVRTPADGSLRTRAMLAAATPLYAAESWQAMRLSVVLNDAAFSNEAMSSLAEIRAAVEQEAAEAGMAGAVVHVSGATAEMADVRTLTQGDFYRVSAAALVMIGLIVLVLLRDAVLAGFLMLSTIVGYLAALGLTSWVFTSLLGAEGIDWKVEVFLFVVMAAVGQDYNIFLTARLAQEAARYNARRAAQKAIVATGGIISSCGLIMAATLGSLMTGDLQLLVQLGFAFAAGMLIDTFVMRPLVVPSFVVLTGRTGRSILPHGALEERGLPRWAESVSAKAMAEAETTGERQGGD